MTDVKGTLLTSAALLKLQDELEYLTTTGRDEIVARIAEARSHGDLKENSEYDTAKNDQGLMEARIRQLKHIIDHAEVLEAGDSDVVMVGSVATVIDDDGDEMEFFIAASERTGSPVSCSLRRTAPSVPPCSEQNRATMSTTRRQAAHSPTT